MDLSPDKCQELDTAGKATRGKLDATPWESSEIVS
jgi:hypothetical protein